MTSKSTFNQADQDGHHRNPYLGLAPFQEEDAHLFFGRGYLIAQTFVKLNRFQELPIYPNVLTLVGESGSGKSSLINAGLIPVFRKRGFSISCLTPTEDPFEALAQLS